MKFVTQENGTRTLIRLEVTVDGEPEGTYYLFVTHGMFKEVVGHILVQPTTNAVVCLHPCNVDGARRNQSVDVVEEAGLAAHREERGRPLGGIGDYNSRFRDTCDLTAMVA